MSIIYGRGRFPKLVAPRTCRGCHSPIPKGSGRRTWCSRECYEKFEPSMVIRAVQERDRGVCQICGIDIHQAHCAWRKAEPDRSKDFQAWIKWRREKPKEEYHHIVPFSEGGLTVLENMQTLCVPCHRKITREFRQNKKEER